MTEEINPIIEGMKKASMIKEAIASVELDKGQTQTFSEDRKEVGVWIVYDLEANRKIQEMLMKEKFAFKFDPQLNIDKEMKEDLVNV